MIVKKLNESKLLEMALKRSDAIEFCINLGKQFTDHFNTIMDKGRDDIDFNHHCVEMQVWFDQVKNIILKHNNKKISSDNLINWFFTVGSDVETVIKDDYQDIYNSLYLKLLNDRNNSSVKDILIDLMRNYKL